MRLFWGDTVGDWYKIYGIWIDSRVFIGISILAQNLKP
jgi:hypothetical protein